MSQLLEIPRSMIVVRSEDNPRTSLVEDDVRNLAQSIEKNGLVSALTVEPIVTDGQVNSYRLAAGYTRIAALDSIHGADDSFLVPCIVKDEGTADLTAIIENVVRTDLPPVDEALRYEQLIDKGMTDVGIANQVGIPLARVRARLEILELNNSIVVMIAAGKLPISVVKPLLKVQKYSPALALEAAKYAKAAPHLGALLAKHPAQVLQAVAAQKTKPFWSFPCTLTTSEARAFLQAGDAPEDAVAALLKRMTEFDTAHHEARWELSGQEDFDVLRGNGALIATEKQQPHGVIYDPTPALQLLTREVADKEQFRAAQAKREAEYKLRSGKTTVDPTADEETQKAQAEAAKQARQQAIELAKSARGLNLALGTQLVVDDKSALKRSNDEAIRLICLELIGAIQLGKVARAGLRLVLAQLQQEETKNVGGVVKKKVVYLQTISDCEEAARKWVEGASNTDELVHRTLCVLLAAEGALQEAVAQSSRQFPGLSKGTPQEMRRKLVAPFIHGSDHETRVKNQWAAIDDNKTYDFPAHAVPDETPEAGQPDVPPEAA